jgi:hypothetical protein
MYGKNMLLEIPFFIIVTFYEKPHCLGTGKCVVLIFMFLMSLVFSHFLTKEFLCYGCVNNEIHIDISGNILSWHLQKLWLQPCNATRSVYWLVVTSPAGPRPIRVPPMLACSGVKPSSSFGIPYCCSFPSYVWRRSSCALHTLASSYCRSWTAAFFRHNSSCNVWAPGGYASFTDHIVLNVFYYMCLDSWFRA